MTHDEFMFDHDLQSAVDLIERHLEYHGLKESHQEEKIEKVSLENAKGFFI